jgi:CMP-2-keto-3-deoxyoctulosonic acid synthetase
VMIIDQVPRGVDTPEDLIRARNILGQKLKSDIK